MPAYLNSIIADAKPRSTPAANRASLHDGLPGAAARSAHIGDTAEQQAAQALHQEPNPVKINQPQQVSAGRHQSIKLKPAFAPLVMQPESKPDNVLEEPGRINDQPAENAISRPLSGTISAGKLSEQSQTPYRDIDTQPRDKREGHTTAEPAGNNTRAVQAEAGERKQPAPESMTTQTENNKPPNPADAPVQKEPKPALPAQQESQLHSSIPEQQSPPWPETTPPDSVMVETLSNEPADTSVAGLTISSPQATVEAEKEKITPVEERGGAYPETAAAEVVAPGYILPYTQPQSLVKEIKDAGAQETAATVHIGQIDIIVQTDSKPVVPRQTEQRGTPDLSSRYYLRRLL
jgi:hypothetical protein